MDRLTETVKVRLLNGEERDVQVYKYLTYREQQQLWGLLTEGQKISVGQRDLDLDAGKYFTFQTKLAETVWADKNISLDDVEADSLSEVIKERFERFLRSAGYAGEKGDNTGGSQ